MRRKGEFGTGQFNREFPFQAAFPDEHSRDLDRGASFYRSHAPITSRRLIDRVPHVIVGFADEADLVAFMRHAGGFRVPPPRRGR